MTFKINLSGKPIHHNGSRVGQHGRVANSGTKIFLVHADPLYSESAFTLSIGILEDMDPGVELIAFRDQKHKHLTVFDSDEFYQVLDGHTDSKHFVLEPDDYGMDDRQVAVKRLQYESFYTEQDGDYILRGGKYDEIKDID